MTHDVPDLLRSFESELVDVEAQLGRLQQRAQSLRTTVEGLRGLASLAPKAEQNTELPIPMPSEMTGAAGHVVVSGTARLDYPYVKPRDAWLKLMREDPRVWSVKEVAQEMPRRGWLDPAVTRPVEAVRAAGRRLEEVDGILQRVGVSSFKLKETSNGAANFAIGAGVGAAAAAMAEAPMG
jgi:hypothetical protein